MNRLFSCTNITRTGMLVMLLWLCGGIAMAATYYVDANTGKDSNAGTASDAPWQTLAKVQATPFAPGDLILLHCGSIWHERLVIPAGGTEDNPLVIGAYKVMTDPAALPRPAIDGQGIPIPQHEGLVTLSGKAHITLLNLEIARSAGDGLVADRCDNLSLVNILAHDNQCHGCQIADSSHLQVERCEFCDNCLDHTAQYAGLRVTTWHAPISDIRITRCQIHDNAGGPDIWQNCGNGIYLGADVRPRPVLRNVVVERNAIYRNGNFAQNQAGRGITGTCDGDVQILRNDIHDNASAGAYLGGDAVTVDVTFAYNLFRNNHLRGFGWITDGTVHAYNNTVYSGDAKLTGLGIEFAGHGTFVIKNNLLCLLPDARYGSFFAVHAGAAKAVIAHNLYWNLKGGAGAKVYLWGDFHEMGNYLDFSAWARRAGDAGSREADPKFVNTGAGNFTLQATSPARNAGAPVGLTIDFAGNPVPKGAPDIGAFQHSKPASPARSPKQGSGK